MRIEDTAAHESSRRQLAHVLNAFRARLVQSVPHHLTDLDVYKIGIATSLRYRDVILKTLYGSGIAKHLADADMCEKISIRPTEFTAMLSLLQGTIDTNNIACAHMERMCSALERENRLHKQAVTEITNSLPTTLLPAKSQQLWNQAPTRCAAVLAVRMTQSQEYLEAVVGRITKVEARRIDEATEELECQESESDAHLYATCIAVETFAQSIANAIKI